MSALTTGTVGRAGELGDLLVRAGADHDRVRRSAERTRAVSAIDSPRESCSSSPRSDDRVRAELGDPDLERDPRPRRRASRRPARRCARRAHSAPRPSARPAFSSAARSSSALELGGAQLLAGEEVSNDARSSSGILRRDGAARAHLEPLPRARLPARPGAATPGARGCCAAQRAQRDPRPGQPRPARRVRGACSRVREWDVALLQECPPRWAAGLAAATAAPSRTGR